MSLDQIRASFVNERSASALAVANEILFADIALPALQDRHYVVEMLSLVGRCTALAPLEPPVSGLFLVSQDAANPLAVPWSAAQRGIPLPLSACYCCEVALGAQFAIGYVMQPGFKITVPRGFFLRGIIQCGDAAPEGPGVGSTLLLKALVIEEPDCKY